MIDLGRWGLRNSKLIYFLVAVSVVGGLLSVGGMSKLEDPEIAMKCALVVTSYPGASAHEVELEVTDVLEKSISSMGDVEYVNSRSMDGISVITVILSDYVQQDRVQEMFSILRRKVGDVQSQLPSGAYESVVADDFGDVYGIFFALTADNYSHKELKEYVQLIQRELEAVTGVSKVSVYGLTPECIHIDLKAEVIASLEITPTEILQYINSYTQLVYAGSYKASGHKLRIDAGQRCTTSEELGNLLLTGRSGEQFRLKDIAYVYEGYDESAYEELMYDGRQAVGIAVSAESDTDITQVGKAVEARMDELFSAIIPNGIELHKVFHQPDKVNDALLMSLKNLIEALVIVIVVVMLSMGLRSGMIIATNLMVIVLGSLLILYFMGGTVQRVSLAAFILALGMLVDDVIVIMDGILLDLKRGLPKEQALTAIGRKTALPLLGATLISVLAFLPIFLSQDSTGEYVRDFFIVLAVSLMMSWLLALIYAPLQAKNMLKPSSKPETNPFEGKSYKMLRKVLHWGLRHRAVTMGGVVMLLAIAGYCWQFMPQGFFPDMSYDQLYIEYKLPEGTDSKRVKADLDEITAYLLSREEITHVTASVGATPARYNLVRPLADGSPSYGELIVDYTSPKKLVATMDEIQQELTDRYPDAYLRLKRYNLMWENYPIAVQFKGPDPAVLRALTEEAVEIMKSSPMLTLPCTDWGNQTPVMHLDYDNPTALKTGITPEYVGMSVLAVTDGIPIGNCHDGDDVKPVYLKVVDKDCETMGNIADASVFTAMGTSVPMRTITDSITVKWHDPIVLRENGQRAMRAQCNPVNGISTENARQTIASRIEAISLPEGYTMEWKGETSASSTASSSLFKYFPLSIVLIISILILLFKDYRKPLIIICCIPLMLIGVVFGMLISGKMFGFIAIVGILGLMGLIVRNGVVLMDEINLQLSEGKDTVEALLDSSATRFRPVMIAALTTIVGMVPLLGDDLFGSLAVTMMSGLLVGTLITLVVLPILYSIVFRIKIK